MGNEHVTDKQLKNDVFTVFGVLKTIGKVEYEYNISKKFYRTSYYSAGTACWHYKKVQIQIFMPHCLVRHFCI